MHSILVIIYAVLLQPVFNLGDYPVVPVLFSDAFAVLSVSYFVYYLSYM
jgi:hypothetical protein